MSQDIYGRSPQLDALAALKEGKKVDKLSEFEDLFCHEFTVDLNATQAYLRARKNPKLKANSAATEGYKLLKKPEIVEKIRTLMKKRVERVQVDSDEVLLELTRLGYSDIRELFNDEGRILPIKEWPEHIARAVSSIDVEELFEYQQQGFHCVACGRRASKELMGQVKKLRLWHKNNALDLLGKHKKLFTEKVEHEHRHTLADLVAGSSEDDPE